MTKSNYKTYEHFTSPEEVKISGYLGKYGDNYALIILGDHPIIAVEQQVDGLDFGGDYVSVYNNGELKWLGDAYKEGIVNSTYLEDIHKAYIRYNFYVS